MCTQIVRLFRHLSIVGIIFLLLLPSAILGHGGEDHGDQKPKTTSNAKGVISHSTPLGDLELMMKHPAMEPDKPTTGALYITRFETNDPFVPSIAKVEIESETGAIFSATVEAGKQAGTYNVAFPAMPEGVYKMRVSVGHDGETDTATFAGIDVKPAAASAVGETSWFSKIVIGVLFMLVIFVLFGLVYFVRRFTADAGVNEEAFRREKLV